VENIDKPLPKLFDTNIYENPSTRSRAFLQQSDMAKLIREFLQLPVANSPKNFIGMLLHYKLHYLSSFFAAKRFFKNRDGMYPRSIRFRAHTQVNKEINPE
jgi:hypothetical protein